MILENMPQSVNVLECDFTLIEISDRILVKAVSYCTRVEFFTYNPFLSWMLVAVVTLLWCIIYDECLKL